MEAQEEDFNDVPSNQGDFDHSAIDPSVRPSKKVRSKVWDHLIKICAENLKDQRAKCKYCGAILGADPAKVAFSYVHRARQDVRGNIKLSLKATLPRPAMVADKSVPKYRISDRCAPLFL
ncbi:hypothetical protein Ancab_018751 [Ancistrocladus abbreviatus]